MRCLGAVGICEEAVCLKARKYYFKVHGQQLRTSLMKLRVFRT
jgi:hypothetical protein